MRIELERRPDVSKLFSILSPFIALGLTLFFGGIMFLMLGKDPFCRALQLLHRTLDGSLVAA